MIAAPTIFANHHQRNGAECHVILKLTDGVTTWYFSDIEVDFAAHVYGLLESIEDISESIDIYTKEWAISTVALTLINAQYRKNSSGTMVRLINDLKDIIRGDSAEIYLMAGPNATALTDCMKRFSGIVLDFSYDAERIYFTLGDKLTVANKVLPENIIETVWPSAPMDMRQKKIPIIYGNFSFNGNDTSDFDRQGNGLAKAFNINMAIPAKCVLADHIIDAFTRLMVKLGSLDDPGIFTTPDVSVNDSGRATAYPECLARVYFYASDLRTDPDYETFISGMIVTDYEETYNRDDSDASQLLDTVDNGYGNTTEGHAMFGFQGHELFNEKWANGLIDGVSNIDMQIKSTWVASSFNANYPRISLFSLQDNKHIYFRPITNSSNWQTITEDGNTGTDAYFRALWVIGQISSDINANGTDNDRTLLLIYELRMRALMVMNEELEYYGELKGKEYGSWITGRSSHYANGDCIEDPAGIIESLLRDYLAFVDADIDMPSFISAENTEIKSRINLHSDNQMKITDIIKQLSEQSTFSFIFTATGNARLISMNNSGPSTDRIIPYSHIDPDTLHISVTNTIINKMNVESRFQQEYGNVYRDRALIENTTSQASYGEWGYNASWPNICGSSATHVANHFIRASNGGGSDLNGIWAYKHPVIEFESYGFINADLEVGDWIELDDETMDPHLLLFGEVWMGKQFLIVEIKQSATRTYIKAVKLF